MELFKDRILSTPFEMPAGDEYHVEWIDDLNGYKIVVPNGELVYIEDFFGKKISDRSVEYFQENESFDWREITWREVTSSDFTNVLFKNISWKQDFLKLYGKIIPLPRLTAWYGDQGKNYSYSGINSEPNEWNDGLSYLRSRVENCAKTSFNSVLLNWYRDGNDSLSWHADNEKSLGKNPTIASANFGVTRDFLLRKNDDFTKKLVVPLKHGTLLLMRGELQHFWQHAVPKKRNISGSRFNLTFRYIN